MYKVNFIFNSQRKYSMIIWCKYFIHNLINYVVSEYAYKKEYTNLPSIRFNYKA